MEKPRYLNFLNKIDEVCSFNDDEAMADLDKQTLKMCWNQLIICFYRFRVNDLMYKGLMLNSKEIIELMRKIDELEAIVATAQEQYRNSLCIINNGGTI